LAGRQAQAGSTEHSRSEQEAGDGFGVHCRRRGRHGMCCGEKPRAESPRSQLIQGRERKGKCLAKDGRNRLVVPRFSVLAVSRDHCCARYRMRAIWAWQKCSLGKSAGIWPRNVLCFVAGVANKSLSGYKPPPDPGGGWRLGSMKRAGQVSPGRRRAGCSLLSRPGPG
jgi:hypothetical protein